VVAAKGFIFIGRYPINMNKSSDAQIISRSLELNAIKSRFGTKPACPEIEDLAKMTPKCLTTHGALQARNLYCSSLSRIMRRTTLVEL
jgi:hypothetical protein